MKYGVRYVVIEVINIKINNLEWYRFFLQTARAGNVTKAAQSLFITQPSVSYGIKQLEEELGVKLFHRLSKGVELTTEGQALLEYVERSFSLLEAGEQKMDALRTLAGGELRIGAGDSLFKHVLLPSLDTYRARYPDVRIRLTHGKTPDIARSIKEGRIDMGAIHLPFSSLQSDPDLDIRPVFELDDIFVAGKPYLDLASRPLSAEELAELPLLLLSPGSSTRAYVEGWFAAQGVAIEADIEMGNVDLLVEFALRGFGVAFVSRSFVAGQLQSGQLVELPTVQPVPPRKIGLAFRRERSLPIAAERYLEMVGPGQQLSERETHP